MEKITKENRKIFLHFLKKSYYTKTYRTHLDFGSIYKCIYKVLTYISMLKNKQLWSSNILQ